MRKEENCCGSNSCCGGQSVETTTNDNCCGTNGNCCETQENNCCSTNDCCATNDNCCDASNGTNDDCCAMNDDCCDASNALIDDAFSLYLDIPDVDFWKCNQIVTVVLTNIITNDDVEKFRKLSLTAHRIVDNVWRLDEARNFLLTLGFEVHNNIAVLPMTDDLSRIRYAFDLIVDVENRRAEHKSQKRRKQGEIENSNDAERNRILQEFENDRATCNTREAKDSKARNIGGKAQVKRFCDIGVDLNKGG